MADQAYGQTDVMNDRNYLYTLLRRGPKDPMALLAQQRLDDLNKQETLNQQATEFGFRQKAADEATQSRKDALSEAEKGRTERSQVRAEIAQQALHDRKTQGLVAAMNSLSYDQTPEGKAALVRVRSEYMKEMGITDGTPGGTPTMVAKTTGEYGPSGPQVKTGTAPATTGATYDNGAFVPPAPSGQTPVNAGPTLSHDWLQNAPKTVNADGTITTHLPSGGTATAYDRSTPQGLVAINTARQESSRLQGIPFVPVTATRAAYAANVPTTENPTPVGPNAFGPPPVVTPHLAATIPVGLPNPVATPAPAPTPPAGVLQPSVFGNVNFNTGAAPAPTPYRPSPVPTPSPIMTDEQRRLLALQQNPYAQ